MKYNNKNITRKEFIYLVDNEYNNYVDVYTKLWTDTLNTIPLEEINFENFLERFRGNFYIQIENDSVLIDDIMDFDNDKECLFVQDKICKFTRKVFKESFKHCKIPFNKTDINPLVWWI